jgi:hypothetical protein
MSARGDRDCVEPRPHRRRVRFSETFDVTGKEGANWMATPTRVGRGRAPDRGDQRRTRSGHWHLEFGTKAAGLPYGEAENIVLIEKRNKCGMVVVARLQRQDAAYLTLEVHPVDCRPPWCGASIRRSGSPEGHTRIASITLKRECVGRTRSRRKPPARKIRRYSSSVRSHSTRVCPGCPRHGAA